MNAILRVFPDQFATDRLLRCPLPGDGIAVHEVIVESHTEFIQWMPFAVNIQTPAEVEKMCVGLMLNFYCAKICVFTWF